MTRGGFVYREVPTSSQTVRATWCFQAWYNLQMSLEGLNSGPYRKYRAEIEGRSSIPTRDENFETQLKSMGGMFIDLHDFDHKFAPEDLVLTPEEETDIKNFMQYAQKRLEAGAITSPAYHRELIAGDTATPITDLTGSGGHDIMHAFVAWLASDGDSLIPAYFAGRKGYVADKNGDYRARLQEAYVFLFSALNSQSSRVLNSSLESENSIEAAIAEWEKGESYRFSNKEEGLAYLRENRLPQLESVMKHAYELKQSGESDPKLAVHEFQRLAAPLLERLRSKKAMEAEEG